MAGMAMTGLGTCSAQSQGSSNLLPVTGKMSAKFIYQDWATSQKRSQWIERFNREVTVEKPC